MYRNHQLHPSQELGIVPARHPEQRTTSRKRDIALEVQAPAEGIHHGHHETTGLDPPMVPFKTDE